MQGRDSFDNETAILEHDVENKADLQSPKFFIPEDFYDNDEKDLSPPPNTDTFDELANHSTQLEDLQQLLEIAHQNEEDAKLNLSEIARRLKAAEKALEEIKLQSGISQTQDKLIIENLQKSNKFLYSKLDTAVDLTETLRLERDQALLNQNEEKLKSAKLQLNLNDAQLKLEQSEASYEKKLNDSFITLDQQRNETTKLKKVILKQSHILNDKDREIARLGALIENNKPYPHNFPPTRQPFFRENNPVPEIKPDIIFLGQGQSKNRR